MRRGRAVACALLISSTQSLVHEVTASNGIKVDEEGIRYGKRSNRKFVSWEEITLVDIQSHKNPQWCKIFVQHEVQEKPFFKNEWFTFTDTEACGKSWRQIEIYQEKDLEKQGRRADRVQDLNVVLQAFFIVVIVSVLAWVALSHMF